MQTNVPGNTEDHACLRTREKTGEGESEKQARRVAPSVRVVDRNLHQRAHTSPPRAHERKESGWSWEKAHTESEAACRKKRYQCF